MTDELFYGTKMYHQPFSKLCEPLQQYLGTSNAAYFNVNADSSVTNIHSNYKWMENYIRGQHYDLDPHMVHPNNMTEGFALLCIDDTYRYQKYQDVLENVANVSAYGFTYVTKTDFDFTAWCFTTNQSSHKFINTLFNQSQIIKSLIQNLEKQLKSTFLDLEDNKARLINLKGNLFFQQTGIVFRNKQGGINCVN